MAELHHLLVDVLLPLFIIFFSYLFIRGLRYPKEYGICNHPSCARCQGKKKFNKEILLHRLEEYKNSNIDKDNLESSRITAVINSLDRQVDIVKRTYSLSGYIVYPDCTGSVQWILPELKPQAIWSRNDVTLQCTIAILENTLTIQSLKQEYNLLKFRESIWLTNETPKGRWKVLPLYNQGVCIMKHCDMCPAANAVLQKLTEFMNGSIFSYAMYSALEPGSIIEPHTGPCNFRLRCHIPLQTPDGFMFQVGKECMKWEEGKVIVFDDSLVHKVWYDKDDHEENDRVVFIVDIWHPQVTINERNALNAIFYPE